MAEKNKGDPKDPKAEKLAEKNNLNQKPQSVMDELFLKYDFFDSRDLMQVKYEMVRRVQKDNWTVKQASTTFGFSRPSFYEAQKALENEGLPGLLPQKRGPKQPHKLSDDVMEFVEQMIKQDNTLRAPKLAALIKERFGFTIHPRSIERSIERRKKKRKQRK